MRVGIEAFNDNEAEESLLGAMLLSRGACLDAIDLVEASDFHRPLHAQIFAALIKCVENGTPIDYVTVASAAGDPELVATLSQLQMNVPYASNVKAYARLVYDKSQTRQLFTKLEEMQSRLKVGENVYEVAALAEQAIDTLGSIGGEEPESMTIYELAERMDAIAPVVIPGLLKQDYRTIIVGGEGSGKSVLLRTVGISASQGIHPFSHQDIPPIRVLHVDLENPAEGIIETGLPLMNHMKKINPNQFDAERYRLFRRPGGIDIRKMSDLADLQREIAFHKPDLVCMGPVYKMYQKKSGESYEDSADAAMHVLDKLRFKYKFALLLEHHAPKGKPGDREMSPFGSQRWLAWPEAGVSLYADKEDPTIIRVDRFRGDRLSGINWPDKLVRSREYILKGIWDSGPSRPHQISYRLGDD